MKKIVFIITDCDFGGAEQMLYELCRGLAGKFSVQVLALKSKGHFAKLIEESGVPVKSFGLGPKIGAGYFAQLSGVFFKIRHELKTHNPDLVQGVLFQGNLLAKLAGRAAGCKLILCSLHTFERGALKQIAEKLTHSLADRYIVVSEALKKFCAEKFSIPESEIVVIRNGIASSQREARKISPAELGVKTSGALLGAIGRLHREKGIDLLLRAFARLCPELPGLGLVVIGDGPERDNLAGLAEQLGIRERVLFSGFLPEPERFLPLFSVFVLPSRIEAMPVALMQAMAAGMAIVATRVGAVAELIDDEKSGLLVPAEDESRLAQAIRRILREPALAARLGAEAKSKAEREFSLDKMLASYEQLYTSLLEGQG